MCVGGGGQRSDARRAAQRVHPDKNHAPAATEAFKKVSSAIACLSDPQKRAAYDATGNEDPQVHATRGGGGGGGHDGGFGGGMSPEDIFNMFFGGHPGFHQQAARGFAQGGGGVRQATTGQEPGAARRPRQAAQPTAHAAAPDGGPNLRLLTQLVPLLLMLLLTVFTFGGTGEREPLFSLESRGEYVHRRETASSGVTLGIPYFVRGTFAVASDRRVLRQARGGRVCVVVCVGGGGRRSVTWRRYR